jgi:hypothetical protein
MAPHRQLSTTCFLLLLQPLLREASKLPDVGNPMVVTDIRSPRLYLKRPLDSSSFDVPSFPRYNLFHFLAPFPPVEMSIPHPSPPRYNAQLLPWCAQTKAEDLGKAVVMWIAGNRVVVGVGVDMHIGARGEEVKSNIGRRSIVNPRDRRSRAGRRGTYEFQN